MNNLFPMDILIGHKTVVLFVLTANWVEEVEELGETGKEKGGSYFTHENDLSFSIPVSIKKYLFVCA